MYVYVLDVCACAFVCASCIQAQCACMYMFVYAWYRNAYMYMFVYAWYRVSCYESARAHVPMQQVFMHACMYACMYACMHACIHTCHTQTSAERCSFLIRFFWSMHAYMHIPYIHSALLTWVKSWCDPCMHTYIHTYMHIPYIHSALLTWVKSWCDPYIHT